MHKQQWAKRVACRFPPSYANQTANSRLRSTATLRPGAAARNPVLAGKASRRPGIGRS
jgi:hypothetical protein